jgi:hypothetical protein
MVAIAPELAAKHLYSLSAARTRDADLGPALRWGLDWAYLWQPETVLSLREHVNAVSSIHASEPGQRSGPSPASDDLAPHFQTLSIAIEDAVLAFCTGSALLAPALADRAVSAIAHLSQAWESLPDVHHAHSCALLEELLLADTRLSDLLALHQLPPAVLATLSPSQLRDGEHFQRARLRVGAAATRLIRRMASPEAAAGDTPERETPISEARTARELQVLLRAIDGQYVRPESNLIRKQAAAHDESGEGEPLTHAEVLAALAHYPDQRATLKRPLRAAMARALDAIVRGPDEQLSVSADPFGCLALGRTTPATQQ